MSKRFLATMTWNSKIFAVSVLGWMPGLILPCHARVDFKSEILPVLEAKCVSCHKAPFEKDGKTIKPKADFRLDAAWGLQKGGESQRPVLVAGNALKSFLYEVVTLPPDTDMFMPQKGDPLTEVEIEKLKTWINEGADFAGWEGNLTGKPTDQPALTPTSPHERDHDLLYKRLAEGLPLVPEETLKKLKLETGAQISSLMPGGALLRVDFLTGVGNCNDASIESLLVIKENIAHLDLARTKVTDVALSYLKQLPRLTRLDLRKTSITDAGITSLKECNNLVYLNLFDAGLTDASVPSLSEMTALRNIYISGTKISSEGISKLHEALPETEIVGDLTLPEGKKPKGGGERKKKKKKN